MGRPVWFRKRLADAAERYPLAVPSNTSRRDQEAEPPPYAGHGHHPKVPFRNIRAWCAALPARAWTRLTVGDGEKGPLVVEIVARGVESRGDRKVVGFEETLVIVRFQDGGVLKHDDFLTNLRRDRPLGKFARVAAAAHRIEVWIKRSRIATGPDE